MIEFQNGVFVGRQTLIDVMGYLAALPSEWNGYFVINGSPSQTTVGVKGYLSIALVHFGEYNSASYNEISSLQAYDPNNTRFAVSVSHQRILL